MTGRRIRRRVVTLGTLLTLLFIVIGATIVGTAVAQEEVTVDVDAALSHAPGENTTITLDLVEEDSGTIIDQATVTVGPNATDAGDVTLTADFGGSLDEGDSLAVEAEATDGNTNYEADAAQVTTSVEEGETYTVTGELELAAEPLTVTTDAELTAPPGEETEVRFWLVVRNDAEQWAYIIDNVTTTVGPDETLTDDVTLAGDFENEHLNSSHDRSTSGDKLAVVIDTIGGNTDYEGYTIWGGHLLRPGTELDERGEARLDAEPVTVSATAQLSHEPVEETAVTFELVDTGSGTVVDNATALVSTAHTETGEVTLTAAFGDGGLDGGEGLTLVASGTHYDDSVVAVTPDVRAGDAFDVHEGLALEAHKEAEFERTNVVVEPTDTDGVVTVSVDVENVGDAPGYYDLAIDADGERVFSDVRQQLAPGETVSDSIDIVLPESGEYEISVAEIDNHPRSQTVTVDGPPGGIAITEYEVSETALLVDETLTVEATLENDGAGAAAIDVPLVVDGTVVASETVGLAASGTETVTFEWTAGEPGPFDVTVGTLDRTPVVVRTELSADEYVSEVGAVEMAGLQAALGDWQDGDIDTDVLRDVIDAWVSQDASSAQRPVVM